MALETLTRTESINTKKVVRRTVSAKFDASRWSLPAVLCLQALLSVLTLRNTASQDEALYLFAGRQILHSWLGGPPVIDQPYTQYFSGFPYFYPIIGGALDWLGGLELARVFSLLCMMSVTLCAHYVTKKIFGRGCAIWAAILLAFQGPILFLGQLATYDALCLLLLASATALAVKVSTARSSWLALGIGPLLFLSIVAKYAGLLFVPPILALLILFAHSQQGWIGMLRRLSLALLSFLFIFVGALVSLHKDVIMGISFTTTNRVAIVPGSSWTLLGHIVELSGVAFILAALGLVLAGRRRLLIGLLLFGSAFLAPAYHLSKGELVSLDKHLSFGLFFVAPLIGCAVGSMTRYHRQAFSHYYWLSGLAVFLIVFSLGVEQSQYLFREWTPSSNMTYLLETQVHSGSGRYLAEDYDISHYYLQNVSQSWQWNSLDFFTYADKTHHQLLGDAAYAAALRDHYFDLIELSFAHNTSFDQHIRSLVEKDHNYALIAKIPYQDEDGNNYFWIWRKIFTDSHPS